MIEKSTKKTLTLGGMVFHIYYGAAIGWVLDAQGNELHREGAYPTRDRLSGFCSGYAAANSDGKPAAATSWTGI